MTPISVLWIAPIVFVIFVSTRSFDDIAANGLGGLPQSFSLEAFRTAWVDGQIGRALLNSLIVTVTTVILVLFLSSLAAFALSRYSIPFRRTILLLMLAGNLLPPQILLIPVSKICEALGIYDTLTALIIVQVGFGLGFYTFVLYGFMRGLPNEVFEAARIDGAADMRIFATIVHAAVPTFPGRTRRPGQHLDLQRPDLGHDRAADPDQVPHHGCPAEPAGRVRELLERGGRRSADRRHPHRHRLLRLPEALRLRIAGGSQQVALTCWRTSAGVSGPLAVVVRPRRHTGRPMRSSRA